MLGIEQIEYARGDTHYLLYIYDMMRMQLAKLGSGTEKYRVLDKVFRQSKETCLIQYRKRELRDVYYYTMIRKCKETHSAAEVKTLKLILKWRDYVARVEDESPDVVCPHGESGLGRIDLAAPVRG